MGPVKSVCLGHEDLVKLLTSLSSSVRWLVRIGSWMLGVMVLIMGGFIPVLFNMNSSLAALQERVNADNKRIENMEREYVKAYRRDVQTQVPLQNIP